MFHHNIFCLPWILCFSMSWQCVNNSYFFCYIFGQFTLGFQKRTIMPTIKMAYELYFGCKIGDQYKLWAPIFIVQRVLWTSETTSYGISRAHCFKGTDRSYLIAKFAWLIFFNKYQQKRPIEYPNQPSALRPVAHSEEFLVLEPCEWYRDGFGY
jgi:hypothetical protein